ncbi:S1 family peptidase [Streptomyces sp. NBC_01803]|uniref:S1 family peptidase n=1 Tax=Streptomyces sp. NBC_01803 TaxID=2975946 RepID=UPI002DD98BC6|nr:S1 family peptidase [Streptomyces sp. NBC_01803]WSA43393.1 S1 family peptidase [Streptomyces sp. NBC_01803]
MSTERTTIPRRHAARRWARAIATAAGLLAVAAFLTPGGAHAEQAGRAGTFSASQLASVSGTVRAADVRGTAWAVDPASGTVRVTADETVSAREIARLRRGAGDLAGALVIDRAPGRLTPRLQGGDPIYASAGRRCSLGFNVRVGTADAFITAGHCTEGLPHWYTTPTFSVSIGPTVGSSFPTNDYGLAQYTNPGVPRPGTINCDGEIIDIIGVANAYVGMPVKRVGSTTGCHSGTVTGLNYTVNYGSGDIVYGLIRTSLCAEPGDSGGPVFSGQYAVGIVSGGSGTCSTGGTTFVQPIGEILAAYGATLT